MLHALPGRLWRGMPWFASGVLHLVLFGAVLALAARAVPRLPFPITAELVAPEPEPPPAAEPPKPVARPPAPRTTKPPPPKAWTRLPQLIEVPPSRIAAVPEVQDVHPPEPVREQPRPEAAPARQEAQRPEPDATSSAPERGDRARSLAADARPALSGSTRPGSGLTAAPSEGSGELPASANPAAGLPGPGGVRSGTAGIGRGAAAGQGLGVASGGAVTRTAIPRGGYQVQPRYPASARRQGAQGTTLLRVFVAVDGRVTEVNVERTAGHAELDEAAAEAVRRWRFEPARSGDTPVAMWVLLPVEFRLK